MPNAALTKLDRALTMLAEARTLAEVKNIRNMAEAARLYAKAAHMGRDAEYRAAEISLLAAHKAGTILRQLPRAKPKAKGGRVRDSDYWRTLHGSGTPYRTAQRWQAVASKPEELVEKYFTWARKKEHDISTAGFLRAFKTKAKKSKDGPYTHRITIPLKRTEYSAISNYAGFAYYDNEYLKKEAIFIRAILADYFRRTGMERVMDEKTFRVHIAEWVKRPIEEETPEEAMREP